MMAHLKSWLSRRKPRHGVVKFYPSFESAAKQTTTYFDPDIVEVVVEKTKRLKTALPDFLDRQQTQNHFVFSRLAQQTSTNKINIMDWGGAAGASYFLLKAQFGNQIRQWQVVETRPMAAGATSLADDKLSFTSSLDEVSFDKTNSFLWAQGILNFIDDPLDQLRGVLKKEYKGVYISRTSFTENQAPLIYRFEAPLQNHGPGTLKGGKEKITSYPFTLISWPHLRQLLDETGYEVHSLFDEGTETLNDQLILVRGLLAFKK